MLPFFVLLVFVSHPSWKKKWSSFLQIYFASWRIISNILARLHRETPSAAVSSAVVLAGVSSRKIIVACIHSLPGDRITSVWLATQREYNCLYSNWTAIAAFTLLANLDWIKKLRKSNQCCKPRPCFKTLPLPLLFVILVDKAPVSYPSKHVKWCCCWLLLLLLLF